MNYYRRMKDLREDNDLTQQDIANYLKITRGTYSMYECGSNIIPLHLLDKLSLKYQVSIDYLVGLSNEKNDKNIKEMNFDVMCQRLKEIKIISHNKTYLNLLVLHNLIMLHTKMDIIQYQ